MKKRNVLKSSLDSEVSMMCQGLESTDLSNLSAMDQEMLQDLYEKDKKMQSLHWDALKDSDHGRKVVEVYQNLLQHRQRVVDMLSKNNVKIPWQFRLTIKEMDSKVEITRDHITSTNKVKQTNTYAAKKKKDKDNDEVFIGYLSFFAFYMLPVVIALVIILLFGHDLDRLRESISF